MSKEQTEAERLAKTWHSRITLRQRIDLGGVMTKELRRLAAANAELLAALERIADETAATWVCDVARAAITKHQPKEGTTT